MLVKRILLVFKSWRLAPPPKKKFQGLVLGLFEVAPRSGINLDKIDHASCLLGMVHRNPEGHENYITTLHSNNHDRGMFDSASMTGVVELRKGSHVWVKVDTKKSLLEKNGNPYLAYDGNDPFEFSSTFTGIRVGS